MLLIALAFQVSLSVLFNDLYGRYGDLLQEAKKLGAAGLKEFYEINLEWFILACIYTLVAAVVNYTGRRYAFDWRKAMTDNYIPRLKNTVEKIEGESQRIQEDPMEFASIMESMGLEAAKTIMLLIFFIPVLWHLSLTGVSIQISAYIAKYVPFSFTNALLLLAISVGALLLLWLWKRRNHPIFISQKKWINTASIVIHWMLVILSALTLYSVSVVMAMALKLPELLAIFIIAFWCLVDAKWLGVDLPKPVKSTFLITCILTFYFSSVLILPALVWLAIFTSVGGTYVSWKVGYFLPTLEYNNQKVEAKFRKELVLGEDDRVHHAVAKTLYNLFAEVENNYRKLYLHYAYYDLWSNWFGLVVAFLPGLIIAPSIFTGTATLGVLNQVENVFFKVNNGFAFLMNNWTRITKVRSIVWRLGEFEANLHKYEAEKGE